MLSVGAHLLGAIVNDVSKSSRYGYYSSYGYSYGYYGDGRHKRKRNENITTAVLERTDRLTGMDG